MLIVIVYVRHFHKNSGKKRDICFYCSNVYIIILAVIFLNSFLFTHNNLFQISCFLYSLLVPKDAMKRIRVHHTKDIENKTYCFCFIALNAFGLQYFLGEACSSFFFIRGRFLFTEGGRNIFIIFYIQSKKKKRFQGLIRSQVSCDICPPNKSILNAKSMDARKLLLNVLYVDCVKYIQI